MERKKMDRPEAEEGGVKRPRRPQHEAPPADAPAKPAKPAMGALGTINEFVGERLRKYWPEEGSWNDAIITDYRRATDEHCLTYNINKPEETFEWVHLKDLKVGEYKRLGKDPQHAALLSLPQPKPVPAPAPLPPPRGPREAKQRLVDAYRAKRAKALLKQCSTILSNMCAVKNYAHAIYFAAPVDSVLLQIPDYPSIVKNPMDYSTVSTNLAKRKYPSPREFQADMELIYSNCALYNKAEDAAGQAGIAAAAAFTAEWEKCGMEIELQNEAVIRHQEDAAVAATPEEGEILEIFVPPLPKRGCPRECLVCHPRAKITGPNAEWEQLKAQWAKQQRSPFVKPTRDTTPAVLDESEQRSSVLVSDLMSIATGREWENTALDVMRKMKQCDAAVKMFLCSPVPVELVPDYTSVIFHPHDLGTIQTTLKKKGFATPEDWIAACRTVFLNVFVYNKRDGGLGSKILDVAAAASTVFEKEMVRLRGINNIVREIRAPA